MIDSHVHLGSLPFKGKDYGSFREYLQVAKSCGIDKYCVVPIGLPENFKDKTTPDNNLVLVESKRNKGIIPVYWFNVFDLPRDINPSYRAVKFHPDIGEVNIDDPRVVGFVRKAGLPVFVHTNEGKGYSTLERAIGLAKKVDVPVIALHSGSVTRTFFNLHDYKFPSNVYLETSGIQYALILKKIYEMVGAKRIVLGSDYPFGDPRVPLGMIESLGASKREVDLMTRKNILDILK